MYLNAGDWVESLTALEYVDGEWSLHEYSDQVGDEMPVGKKRKGKSSKQPPAVEFIISEEADLIPV